MAQKYNLRIFRIYCEKIHFTTITRDSVTPTGHFRVLVRYLCS